MEVLYHIRPCFVGIFPYIIALAWGVFYLQFRFLIDQKGVFTTETTILMMLECLN